MMMRVVCFFRGADGQAAAVIQEAFQDGFRGSYPLSAVYPPDESQNAKDAPRVSAHLLRGLSAQVLPFVAQVYGGDTAG